MNTMTSQFALSRLLGEVDENLQQIYDRVAAAVEEIRQRDFLSALSRLAKRSGIPLSSIRTTGADLRRAFDVVDPNAPPISRKSIQNIKSDVGAAIRLYGIKRGLTLKTVVLTPEWTTLLDLINGTERRFSLVRLARYCSFCGILPAVLTIPELLGLYEFTKLEAKLTDPRETLNQIICTWNWCARNVVGWPKHRLGSPFPSRTIKLAVADFPLGLQTDLKTWQSRVQDCGELDFDGPVKRHRPTTVIHQTNILLRFASLLVCEGIVRIEQLHGLSVLVEPDTVKAGLQAMHRRGNKLSYIRAVAQLLKAIAQHECHLPERDIARLRGFVAKLPRQRGMTEKNKALLLGFDHDAVCALLAVPGKVRASAERTTNPRRCILAFETALFIDILLWARLRMFNLQHLRIDQNIRWERGICVLTFAPHEMKNQRSHEVELPESLSKTLEVFIKKLRPQRPGAAGPYLFAAANGGPKHQSTLANAMQRQILKHGGRAINPHAVRHLIASLMVGEDPAMLPLVSQMLGHASQETTRMYYLPNGSRVASRLHNKFLEEKLRQGGRPKRARQSNGKTRRNKSTDQRS